MKKIFGVCVAAAAAVTVIGASPALAQDAPKVGLVFGKNSQLGVHIPLGDSVAIRPAVAWIKTTAEYEGSMFVSDDVSSRTWVPSVDLLFYLKTWDNTRVYVSPQYLYTRSTQSSSEFDDNTDDAHTFRGMFGAQHTLGSRFAVFGEAGIEHSRRSTGVTVGSSTTSRAWNTRTTFGGMFMF
jgi:hypothetical protein